MIQRVKNLDSPPEIVREDYNHSSNALFHFMKRSTFLEYALLHKALVPRYCIEDVQFLGIQSKRGSFNKLAIPQKCFCDIPLHNITSKFPDTSESEKFWSKDHTHVYGEYAIAFSKEWGERNHLQPIQYINEDSWYRDLLSEDINTALNSENLTQIQADSIMYRLSFIKPLRGYMKRVIDDKDLNRIKNFHDEQEWRFVPLPEIIRECNEKSNYQIQPIIANPAVLDFSFGAGGFIETQSKVLEEDVYSSLWIKFKYDDIRYLIVPTISDRSKCIDFINNLEEELEVKSLLISKILVLDEIRKDW